MMDSYYYRFRDYRAVEETMEIFYSDGVGNFEHLPLVEGISYGDIFYEWPFTSQTPSEKIEEIKDAWDAAVDEANW